MAGPVDVKWCYRILLDREPESHGLRSFTSYVTENAITRSDLVSLFLSSPEFRNRLSGSLDLATGTPIGTDMSGMTIYVDPNDRAIGALLRESATYEPGVTAVVEQTLKPGDVFVDVGASLGYFSVLAGRLVGQGGRVISIEPGPQNQSILLLNIVSNQFCRPEVHQVAVSDAEDVFKYGRLGANGTISALRW